MVRQRFLTHFKPWLYAVIKVGGVIVGYQFCDQIRTHLQYAPLDIGDVVMAATTTLFVLALLCMIWTWGEWCRFKLRRLRTLWNEPKRAFNDVRHRRTVGVSQSMTGRMV